MNRKSLAQGLYGLNGLSKAPTSDLPPFLYNERTVDEARARSAAAKFLDESEEVGQVTLQAAASTALDLTSRQWFRRIWVLQEFLLAKQVIFLYWEHYIPLELLVTAFRWAFHNPWSSAGPGLGSTATTMAYARPLWLSHIDDIPSTLLARESILNGRKLSLREWLRTCQGGEATDVRDFIFGGLSLLYPESLKIDAQRLQLQGDTHSDTLRPPLPPRPGAETSSTPVSRPPTLSPATPKGLWNVLKVDYGVTEVELFVNVAACLLSRNEKHSLDLLSIAAHPRDMSRFDNWEVKPRGHTSLATLPSWAPALGAWAVSLSVPFFSFPPYSCQAQTLSTNLDI